VSDQLQVYYFNHVEIWSRIKRVNRNIR
jgi:hypothetical protein